MKVHYDFTQKELAGEADTLDIPESTVLGEFLRIIDTKVIDAGKNKGMDTTYKTTLAEDQLNGCVVFINGLAPEKMLTQELYNGDEIEFVYGFCGG